MNVMKQFRDGLFFQNPVTVQLLGMCSVMAITTTLFNGLGMGLSVLVILTLSNIIIAALRKIIPNNIRIACFIVVIAGFVTIVDLCLQAFIPALSKSLGLFIPLIVVNCIILGLGYTMVLVIMCVVREFLGNGTIMGGLLEIGAEGQLVFGLGTAAGIRILPEGIPALGMILPVGGFLTLACVIAAMQYILNKPKKGDKKTEEVAK